MCYYLLEKWFFVMFLLWIMVKIVLISWHMHFIYILANLPLQVCSPSRRIFWICEEKERSSISESQWRSSSKEWPSACIAAPQRWTVGTRWEAFSRISPQIFRFQTSHVISFWLAPPDSCLRGICLCLWEQWQWQCVYFLCACKIVCNPPWRCRVGCMLLKHFGCFCV